MVDNLALLTINENETEKLSLSFSNGISINEF